MQSHWAGSCIPCISEVWSTSWRVRAEDSPSFEAPYRVAAGSEVMAFDPLTLLRDAAIAGDLADVKEEGDEIIFGSHRFSKEAPTRVKPKDGSSNYSLWAVYTCLKFAEEQYAVYINHCRKNKITRVPALERKDLLSYLTGKSSTLSQLETSSVIAPETESRIAKRQRVDESAPQAQERDEGLRGEADQKTPQGQEVRAEGYSSAKKELELSTRSSILHSKGKNFSRVLDIFQAVKRAGRADAALAARNAKSSSTTPAKATLAKQYPGTPIIVVPAATSTTIALPNVKDFLENGVFIPIAEKLKGQMERVTSVRVKHSNSAGLPQEFEVVDNINRLTDKHWNRVVAVFVQGPAWQFKGWKWPSPTEVLEKVLGIYVKYADAQPDPNIPKWNVTTVQVHKHLRHHDVVASNEIWKEIEQHMKVKRPEFILSSR